jgi:pantothenate kinase-related protein Tda10
VIVEGWMLGYKPISGSSEGVEAGMQVVNRKLEKYKLWDALYDSVILVGVEDPEIVFEWREQAEKMRRDKGQGALSEAEVRTLCERFLPSY